MRRRSISQRRDSRLPEAAGSAHERVEVVRAADRHHAAELAELDGADAGRQVHYSPRHAALSRDAAAPHPDRLK
jgi:hypothetical protein